MEKFIISTESTADLTIDMIKKLNVEVIDMLYYMDDVEYCGDKMSSSEFYAKLKTSISVRTAMVNEDTASDWLENFLKEGKDILHIGFSSALSGTCGNFIKAAEKLGKKYPERKVIALDSKAASLGEGLLCYYASKCRMEGKSITETADFIEKLKDKLCHYFTVDSLQQLHRGGRVSKTSYWIGSLLSIKPVLHVDKEGRLIPIAKVMGRGKSLRRMVDFMGEKAKDERNEVVYISHADCIDEAKQVGKMITEKFGIQNIEYGNVGPIIGSHSGVGTIALFFVGDHK